MQVKAPTGVKSLASPLSPLSPGGDVKQEVEAKNGNRVGRMEQGDEEEGDGDAWAFHLPVTAAIRGIAGLPVAVAPTSMTIAPTRMSIASTRMSITPTRMAIPATRMTIAGTTVAITGAPVS